MGISRRQFTKGALLAGLAAVFAPLISFGSKTNKAVKEWAIDKYNLVGLKMTHEKYFDKLLAPEHRHLLSADNRVFNTVHEVIEDDKHKFRLVQFMGIEFQYRNEIEYVSNKAKAMHFLAYSFNVAASKGIIGYGCLLPCVSFKVSDYAKVDYKREQLCVWPVGKLENVFHSTYADMLAVTMYNTRINSNIFCSEGELARIYIDSDGKMHSSNGVARNYELRSAKDLIKDEIDRRQKI